MVVISPCLRRRWFLRPRNALAWLALALMVMACPPFAWTIDAIFGVAFLFWFITWNSDATNRTWLPTAAMVLVSVLLLALPAAEWPRRRMPVAEGESSDHLVVIGDSISAGLGERVVPWPAVMQEMTKFDVRNLYQPVPPCRGTSLGNRRIGRYCPDVAIVFSKSGPEETCARSREDISSRFFSSSRAEVRLRKHLGEWLAITNRSICESSLTWR
jgi:hypothetical protein